ncbi:efflux RND transporter periplasmic adaptor subunit [Mesonia aestuariivivens]|uniref:Efflux RND transporter periplasmic adaptor subunit n=1 Tax=Mesonia aestuariivivens TaxID=2796128 RepID=A0ABS6VZU3_9FLAO|nr:efflux RND transporter periplasmic adaptor subunit [Mesonia aestuariivivens]MBW2961122.1 efflux RND transporter periplasmic adaptor subunit [Mesonia aestuariivivens]
MKKYLIYILLIAAGIFLGYLFFNNSYSTSENTHQHSAEEKNKLWTCSMHPQIELEEPGDCPICGMQLIPKEKLVNEVGEHQFTMTKNAMALANIETTVIGEAANEAASLNISGKIKVNKNETATQPAHFNGRIDKLYVKTIGETVKTGQLVAKIYSPELVAAQQELISAYKKRESQPRLYQAVHNKFKNWKIHTKQLQEIEKSGKPQMHMNIFVHVSGVVTSIEVKEGSHIMDGKPIFEVSNLSTVWAEFDVYENEIKSLKQGQKIQIKAEAYPDKNFEAKISFIDPILNSSTRTVTVRVELDNKNNLLKPGMFVIANLKSKDENSKNITIPKSAVMWTGERSLVYLKSNDNPPTLEMREVKLSAEHGKQYTISSGLQKGDEIVTNGTFTVDAAAQLQGKKSMMNKEAPLQLSKKTQQEFSNVVTKYLQLKDALVNDKTEKAQKASKESLVYLENIQISNEKISTEIQSLKNLFVSIGQSTEIVQQRKTFISLSDEMIKILKKISQPQPLYIQKCPMANNNQGAKWLSLEKEIKNPYYGTSMLTCGSVIDIIN